MPNKDCPGRDGPVNRDPYGRGLVECVVCACRYHLPCAEFFRERLEPCAVCGQRPLTTHPVGSTRHNPRSVPPYSHPDVSPPVQPLVSPQYSTGSPGPRNSSRWFILGAISLALVAVFLAYQQTTPASRPPQQAFSSSAPPPPPVSLPVNPIVDSRVPTPMPEPIVGTKFAVPPHTPYPARLIDFKYEVDVNRNDGEWRSFGFNWNGDYELEFHSTYPGMAETNRKALYEIRWNGNVYKPKCWPPYDNNLPENSPARGLAFCDAQLFGDSMGTGGTVGLLMIYTGECYSIGGCHPHSDVPEPIELRISPETVLSSVHIQITTNCDQRYPCYSWPR